MRALSSSEERKQLHVRNLNERSVVTLKALANSSPGLRFGNPGSISVILLRRNRGRVARPSRNRSPSQLLQSCEDLLKHS